MSGPLRSRAFFSSPKKEVILSYTIFVNCCPGSTDFKTLSPLASSAVAFIKRRTTRKFTSASKRAVFISSIVSSIFFSVILDLPLKERIIPLNFSVIFSSITLYLPVISFLLSQEVLIPCLRFYKAPNRWAALNYAFLQECSGIYRRQRLPASSLSYRYF